MSPSDRWVYYASRDERTHSPPILHGPLLFGPPGERGIDVMISALLRGRDHTQLGAVDVVAEGTLAIALSVGGYKKGYRHTDPNEDAAAFACGEGGLVVAVADAHGGADASEATLERLLEKHAPEWTGPNSFSAEDWPPIAFDALVDLNRAILERLEAGDRQLSRTTLSFAVIRPGEDLLAFAAVGDSLLFQVSGDSVCERAGAGERHRSFLGFHDESPESLSEKATAGTASLAATTAIVLATDGLSELGVGVEEPDRAVADAVRQAASEGPDLRPLHTARTLVTTAQEAHRRNRAGDNVASAVAWLGR